MDAVPGLVGDCAHAGSAARTPTARARAVTVCFMVQKPQISTTRQRIRSQPLAPNGSRPVSFILLRGIAATRSAAITMQVVMGTGSLNARRSAQHRIFVKGIVLTRRFAGLYSSQA